MNLQIFTNNIEPEATNQLYTLAKLDAFKDSKIRIMPDVHAGAGCVIGFTADLGDKVIPNIVGVDIGCGVYVVELGKANIDLEKLDDYIKDNIPYGLKVNSTIQEDFDLKQLYCYKELENVNRLNLSIGSLGGGNHFIEVDEDADGNKYLVIHTGSRNLGLQVAKIYQKKAIEYCHDGALKEKKEALIKEYKAKGKQSEIADALAKVHKENPQYTVPNDLCFLEGQERENYLHDMKLCQVFAVRNRRVIANKIVRFLNLSVINDFESIHNYIDDTNMVRKGAISAHKGEKVIIPLNMRDGSIIGIGKGNEEWNYSGPHGAGRLMSRSEAKRTLQLEDFKKAMTGIYTTTATKGTIDESPMAYKNAQEIIDGIKDTVEVVNVIKPIYNFKAEE